MPVDLDPVEIGVRKKPRRHAIEFVGILKNSTLSKTLVSAADRQWTSRHAKN
jgi:hypothetical protein